MVAPSGDQVASRSKTPELWVRLRVGPFSWGAVKRSPRATKSTLALEAGLEAGDVAFDRAAGGPAGERVGRHPEGEGAVLAGSEVEDVQLAAQLVDDASAGLVGRRPAHVPLAWSG